MINFIVVDDIEFYRNEINKAIVTFSIKYDIQVNKYVFENYNNHFRKIANSKLENKVYVLDIETPRHNGINEAEKIRKLDENCIIIFLTSYEKDYYPELLRIRMKYIFISKLEEFRDMLIKHFKIIIDDLYSQRGKLIINHQGILLNIKYNDIIFIRSNDNKNIIKTINSEIIVNKSLDSLLSMLPNHFIRSHRACIVNIKHIIFIKKEIIFSNGIKTSLLSRNYKNNVINAFKKEQNNNGD